MLTEETYTRHLAFLCKKIRVPPITIHLCGGKNPDVPRQAFILFTLARALAVTPQKFTEKDVTALKENYSLLSQQTLTHLSDPMIHYVYCYLLRAGHLLGADISPVSKDISIQLSTPQLFTYPVSLYVFLSTLHEVPHLSKEHPFLETLRQRALGTLEYILFSEMHSNYRSFHFSEFSHWGDTIPTYMSDRAHALCTEKLTHEIATTTFASSGIAKTCEHFARKKDSAQIQRILTALHERVYSRFNPSFMPTSLMPSSDILFTENTSSQHITLDTTAHLIHSYINYYHE